MKCHNKWSKNKGNNSPNFIYELLKVEQKCKIVNISDGCDDDLVGNIDVQFSYVQ